MVAGGYFTDARRTKIRQKTGVGFIEDYFLRSEISDYRRLRTLANLIIGVPFCACLYYLGWKNLNFADFHFAYGVIFKWFMIISTALAFALSPMFRCAMLCVLLGAMGKNGQAPLSLLILENLQDGSITNIVTNYQRTAEILLCHLELQAKIASNRVSMLTGPVEGVLERQIDLGLQMLKDLISTIRSILVPFLAEIKATRTKEDKKLDERDEQISNLARRKALDSMMMNKKKSEENYEVDDNKESTGRPKEDDAKPTWTEFKTKHGRQIAKRTAKRCNDVFFKGVEKCRDFMSSVKDKCYEALPFYLEYFICPKLNTEESCNLHMMLVEMPRLENVFQVSELKMFVSIGANYVKVVLRTAKQVVEALFVFYIYVIFRDSVNLIENYLTDVDYNNCFITSVFWQIDHHREMLGQQAIRFISNEEMTNWKLMNVFSKPTRDEMIRAKTSLITWFITAISATLLIFLDYYFYAFLNAVVSASHTRIEQLGSTSAAIDVEGGGVVANFLRSVVAENRTLEVDSSMTNAHCLLPPQRPDFQHIFTWIAVPLILSLFLQVIFSFVVKRVVLNHFLPFMFPLRDRIRIIHLYNKVLFLRIKHRMEARARIRFCVERWKINEENDEGGWLSYRSWFKLNVLDRLFKTGQCLMCQQKMKPAQLYFCLECPATYCRYCLAETGNECYACQAEEGLVNTEKSLVTYTEKPSERFVLGSRRKART